MEGCWFCLSNPNADVELVASVGESGKTLHLRAVFGFTLLPCSPAVGWYSSLRSFLPALCLCSHAAPHETLHSCCHSAADEECYIALHKLLCVQCSPVLMLYFFAAGEECYIALDKGAITEQHVLVRPLGSMVAAGGAHVPLLSSCSSACAAAALVCRARSGTCRSGCAVQAVSLALLTVDVNTCTLPPAPLATWGWLVTCGMRLIPLNNSK